MASRTEKRRDRREAQKMWELVFPKGSPEVRFFGQWMTENRPDLLAGPGQVEFDTMTLGMFLLAVNNRGSKKLSSVFEDFFKDIPVRQNRKRSDRITELRKDFRDLWNEFFPPGSEISIRFGNWMRANKPEFLPAMGILSMDGRMIIKLLQKLGKMEDDSKLEDTLKEFFSEPKTD